MTENIPTNVFVQYSRSPEPPAQPVNPTTTVTHSAPPAVETLTSAETAAALGVTLNNLRQMVFKKRITPVAKDGRRNLFAKADVEALVAVRAARNED